MSALRALAVAAVVTTLVPRAWADGARVVVLADADPELRRALEATLAPWRITVLVEAAPPAEARAARSWAGGAALAAGWQLRPATKPARFVVWREAGELVVFDRDRGAAEHRAAPAGPLDPVRAAAAALTVKTLMRLPPPAALPAAAPSAEHQDAVSATPSPRGGPALRVQAALATRVAAGLDTEIGARLVAAALVRPWGAIPLRFGLAGEIGTPAELQGGGFKGTWRDASVAGLASWAIERARWDIEPYVGAGVTRSRLDGEDAAVAHHARATLGLLRAGVWARYRVGALSVGGSFGVDAVIDTPAYTRSPSGSRFFEVPPFAFALGVLAAIDLTP